MYFIDIIAGARPNFVKIAAIIHAINEADPKPNFGFRLVHTGQHYDKRMSGDFFEQLGIPEPDVNLEVGSGSQAEQTGKIMLRYEQLLLEKPPALTLVVGDVTSTMACAIVAQKQGVPVAHVEAGIRSGDWTMPEEINRLVTDSITNWFFTTSEIANNELRRTGISDDRIFFVGNTMIDTLLRNRSRFQRPSLLDTEPLLNPTYEEPRTKNQEPKTVCGNQEPRTKNQEPRTNPYLLLTLHRPSNVDDPKQLRAILESIAAAAGSTPVLFPIHPRTKQKLEANGIQLSAPFVLAEPLPYLEFNYLVERTRGIITDSGGITEEATVLGIPCMTLRNSTERPETVELGTNELIGSNIDAIRPSLEKMLAGNWKSGTIPPLWDGQTGPRIVSQLNQLLLR